MALKKKAIIIPAVVVLAVGGGVLGLRNMAQSATQAMLANIKYSAVPAGMNDLSDTISTTGQVIGNGTVDVTTKLNATVSEVKVSLGDVVKEGDLLCVFDSTELQEEYDELQEQLDSSDKKSQSDHDKVVRDMEAAKNKKTSALERAQRAIDKATKERDDAYEKFNKLVGEYNQAIDDGNEYYDYDTVNAQIETLRAGLSAYDDAVTAAQDAYNDTETQYDETIQGYQDTLDAEEFESTDSIQKQMDKLTEQIEQCNVYASQSGIITALNVNEGSLPSSPTLMTIVNTDKTVIELTVRETDISKMQEGMKATVTSKVLPDEEFPAKITRIVNVVSQDAASTEGKAGYKVEVTLDTPNDKLLIGMSATVDVVIKEVGEKLSVPYSGIIEEDGGDYVLVAEAADDEEGGYIVSKKKIVKGEESDFYVEVAGGEVKEGDLIVEQDDDAEMPLPEEGERIQVNEKK